MASPPTIGDAGIPRTIQMGRRRRGLTIPEVREEFNVGYYSARRFVMRMIREGVLRRTDKRRRRIEMFDSPRGAGGVVYRATRKAQNRRREASEWEDSRKRRRRRRSRAR